MGRMMHPIELRPERGFVNVVPFGMMMLRHYFRKIRAKGNYELFRATGIFNETEVRAGTMRVFEIISQHALKNKMADLIARNFCGDDMVWRFDEASKKMSNRQRELLNLREEDVYAIAPGVLGPFQLICRRLQNKQPMITYSLLCCAFYKKQMLFDAVRDLPLVEAGKKVNFIRMPTGYGYAAPRLVFAFITFGNKIEGNSKIDEEVHLLEFQYLVIYGLYRADTNFIFHYLPTVLTIPPYWLRACSPILCEVIRLCAQYIISKYSTQDLWIGKGYRQRSTSSTEEFADVCSLAKVWNRAPLRAQDHYPPDQKAFSITRDSTETTSKYQNGLCFKEENNLVYTQHNGADFWTRTMAYILWLKTKFFMLGTETSLSMSSEDLVKGGQKVFRMILDAVVGSKVESLAPLTLGSSVLDNHRKQVWNLKEKQKSALMVTNADFIGVNGFVYNWDGFSTERGTLARMVHSTSFVSWDAAGEVLDRPYFKYSIILASLLKKKEIYKMVRQLPFNFKDEGMRLSMPIDYGFITPRYVVVRIDMCHEVINAVPIRLCEDGLLYDFHIHSF
ncbi:hypothetical protein DICVIV_10152 [Dictyocaulus viviparus]|uniref:Uncharacterized protein n=1 Tax=Dictyocaulus viviparus TaxID=29172 RepID=A0A0D8XN78_DICVI|nr:hypothetical protein DICVIV_10152 [Dictyocaulus viviparus]